MTDSIDTSVLVAAMIQSEAFHTPCRALVVSGKPNMYTHGLAETFSTLTGGRKAYRLSAALVTELLEDHFVPRLTVVTLTPAETLRAMREAEARGVRGGAIFDFLHLVAARKAKVRRLYTLNVSNFRSFYRSGDPEIVHP
jgi:predicted nucleic acid-binding protein